MRESEVSVNGKGRLLYISKNRSVIKPIVRTGECNLPLCSEPLFSLKYVDGGE